jgi:methionine sulfoxide reductase heme-binding subunit
VIRTGLLFTLAAVAIVLVAPHAPAGPAAWTLSRAAGVTAFAALALDVIFGLFISTGLVDRYIPRAASVDVHRWLSGVSLSLVGVHALALLADTSVHFGVTDLIIPGRSSYRPGAVALGIIATYVAVVVHQSFGWRKRISGRTWRTIHFAAFGVFVLAVAHGLSAGSDARHAGLRLLYVGTGAIVAALVAVRGITATFRRVANGTKRSSRCHA